MPFLIWEGCCRRLGNYLVFFYIFMYLSLYGKAYFSTFTYALDNLN